MREVIQGMGVPSDWVAMTINRGAYERNTKQYYVEGDEQLYSMCAHIALARKL